MKQLIIFICGICLTLSVYSQNREDYYVGYVKNNKEVLVYNKLYAHDSILLKALCGYLPSEPVVLISMPFEIKYIPFRGYSLFVYKVIHKSLSTDCIQLSLIDNKLYLPKVIKVGDEKKLIKFAKLTDLPACRIK
jgi:hypothetical protein